MHGAVCPACGGWVSADITGQAPRTRRSWWDRQFFALATASHGLFSGDALRPLNSESPGDKEDVLSTGLAPRMQAQATLVASRAGVGNRNGTLRLRQRPVRGRVRPAGSRTVLTRAVLDPASFVGALPDALVAAQATMSQLAAGSLGQLASAENAETGATFAILASSGVAFASPAIFDLLHTQRCAQC